MTERQKGLLIMVAGVMALSPDALLVKMSGLPAPAVIFWRGLFVGLTLSVGMALWWRGEFLARMRAIGRPGILVAVLYGVTNNCFVAANTYTAAANVLVIIATTPLISSIFGRIFLRERVAPRTWVASVVALGGVALVAGEQISLNAGLGEFFALICVIGISLAFVVIRKSRAVNMIPAITLGMFMAGAPAVFFIQEPATGLAWFAVLAAGLVFIPLADVAISLGPRYLPAGEVGLILLLETVFGSLWVWLVLSEAPTQLGFIGGLIILATLIVHTLIGLRRERRLPA
ncbi:DMT family transporter [Minwuia thermotolerans]|uniref:EamA/RhaT family transporter n=1 Tax=Minwuia thermotolerans TaxID=2056226 RepID=A0A2M9G793_9PROT|nr:DMT family transporter [Minwuia thermotolerans]PJK31570.1 EamA/RhaT family transporter [Minwuia thermotolerans]